MEGHILQVGEVVMGLTRFSKTREEAARRVTLPAAPGVGDLQPILLRLSIQRLSTFRRLSS